MLTTSIFSSCPFPIEDKTKSLNLVCPRQNAFNINWSKLLLSHINSLQNNILDWSKMNAFADDKINVSEKLKLLLGTVENIVGKGENAGYVISIF